MALNGDDTRLSKKNLLKLPEFCKECLHSPQRFVIFTGISLSLITYLLSNNVTCISILNKRSFELESCFSVFNIALIRIIVMIKSDLSRIPADKSLYNQHPITPSFDGD